jgi:hypothetical protein
MLLCSIAQQTADMFLDPVSIIWAHIKTEFHILQLDICHFWIKQRDKADAIIYELNKKYVFGLNSQNMHIFN